jgi:hypothetical protein
MRASMHRLAAAAALFVTAACGGDKTPGGSGGEPPAPGLMQGWGNASVLGGNGVLTYALTVDEAALDQLGATASTMPPEQYVAATLSVSGRMVGQVGLRYRGTDIGPAAGCFENGQVCAKPSLKLKFDRFDPDRRFESLTALNLNAMAGDPSLLRERLAAEVYRRMEIEAPRVAHAFVTMNGEPKGLYAVVENPDAAFAEAHWRDAAKGNLYRESWPNEVQADNYTPALETNIAAANNMQIAMFAQALFAAKPADLPAVLDQFAHVDQLLSFVAVDRALNNIDGVTSFYCNNTGQDCFNHNFYWYQHETDNRFLLVPWDLTATFYVQTGFDKLPAWDQPQTDCGRRGLVELQPVLHPACDPIFQGLIGAGRPAYERALDKLLGAWNVGQLQDLVDKWASEITAGVAADPHGPGQAAWHAGVENLKVYLIVLRERLQAIREGKTVSPFGLMAPGNNDFEDVSALAFQLGVSGDTSPRSGSSVNLNISQALAGAQDLYFGFDLANDEQAATSEAKAPWVQARLPLAGAPKDISAIKQIRMRLAADDIRKVRVELDSTKYPDIEATGRFGRELILGKTPNDVVIPLAELGYAGLGNDPAALTAVLAAVSGLVLTPTPKGLDSHGVLPKGKTDHGFVRIDDIRFEE